MEEITLQAKHRNVIGKQVKALRRSGLLPAVIYGRRIDPIPVSLDLREATHILSRLGPSSLVTVDLEGEKYMTLIRDKQRNVLTGELIHVDFQAVSLLDKIRTSVSLRITGEAPAVKEFGAILMTEMDEVTIECLPTDLPESIEVDVSGLREIGDTITIKDLTFPPNVEVQEDPNEIVAVITAPELERVKGEEEAGFAEPEVVEKGKREEEEF